MLRYELKDKDALLKPPGAKIHHTFCDPKYCRQIVQIGSLLRCLEAQSFLSRELDEFEIIKSNSSKILISIINKILEHQISHLTLLFPS